MVIKDYKVYKTHLTAHELIHAPDIMNWKGDFSLMCKGRRISIVGSSKVSPESRLRTLIIIRKLIKKGIIVVNAMDKGISAIVHEAVITEGGKTIVLLETEGNRYNENEDREMSKLVDRGHLLISQLFSNSPKHSNASIIDFTMALISDATLLVEASEKSDARYQAFEALRLGRSVLIMESVVINTKLSWISKILNYGAQVLNMNNFDAIIDDIPYLTDKTDLDF